MNTWSTGQVNPLNWRTLPEPTGTILLLSLREPHLLGGICYAHGAIGGQPHRWAPPDWHQLPTLFVVQGPGSRHGTNSES